MSSSGRQDALTVEYSLWAESAKEAATQARVLAVEQTVEVPEGAFSRALEEAVVGKVGEVVPLDNRRFAVEVHYNPEIAVDLVAAVNLLFGNISMKAEVRVSEVHWPAALLRRFRGPAFGLAGIRGLVGAVDSRALLATAAKPLGLDATELARRCREFALAGIDVIKDDHSITDQSWAPFAERVERCQEAVSAANAASGGRTVYFPNVNGPLDTLAERLDLVRRVGCRGVMLTPMIVGLETVRSVAASGDLAIFGHPALSGIFFNPNHGIAPEIVYGDLFRLAGCDGVIFPNADGRFAIDELTCQRLHDRLRRPMGDLAPALPVAGGGVDVDKAAHWIGVYGHDTMLLIGSSLYSREDLRGAARELRESIERL